MSVADIRRSYDWSELDENSMASTPVVQLDHWLNDAIHANVIDPTAMTLATADVNGQPSTRIVLLKHYDEQGLVFFTNYESRKGIELAANPHACLHFYWPGMERQIRAEGIIKKTSSAESDDYYHSRPLESRISAWASPQSQPITRVQLDAHMSHYRESLGRNPPRPEFWGGFRLRPYYMEFWQGRSSRLHDRLVYKLDSSGRWAFSRVAP